jgi:hypothetical protein
MVAHRRMAVSHRHGSRAVSGVPSPFDGGTFSDVPADDWAYAHIEYAVANNIVAGYGDRTYHPESPVTRGQMAVFICRAFGPS